MNPTKMALIAAALLLPATQALADGEHSKKEIKLLNDSAAALTSSNPDLSNQLRDFASKESGETEENESEQAETSGKEDIKMLRSAADALEKSRPDLCKGLNNYAKKEEREMRVESKEHERSEKAPQSHPQAPKDPGANGY